jgi:hypothetical protein
MKKEAGPLYSNAVKALKGLVSPTKLQAAGSAALQTAGGAALGYGVSKLEDPVAEKLFGLPAELQPTSQRFKDFGSMLVGGLAGNPRLRKRMFLTPEGQGKNLGFLDFRVPGTAPLGTAAAVASTALVPGGIAYAMDPFVKRRNIFTEAFEGDKDLDFIGFLAKVTAETTGKQLEPLARRAGIALGAGTAGGLVAYAFGKNLAWNFWPDIPQQHYTKRRAAERKRLLFALTLSYMGSAGLLYAADRNRERIEGDFKKLWTGLKNFWQGRK